MGLLDIFSKSADEAKVDRLPRGSFAVDRNLRLLASTLPQSYSEETVREIARTVLAAFNSAKEAKQPLRELHLSFGSLQLTAREQRGGAMIFLAPSA